MMLGVYLAIGGAAFWWLFMRRTFESGGALRFVDSERLKILEALGSTVAVPAGRPDPRVQAFLVAKFDPTSASGRQTVELARAGNFPVAISEYCLEVIADPNDSRPINLLVMQRGIESTFAAPGKGYSLIVD